MEGDGQAVVAGAGGRDPPGSFLRSQLQEQIGGAVRRDVEEQGRCA